jgi:hypothetical protein
MILNKQETDHANKLADKLLAHQNMEHSTKKGKGNYAGYCGEIAFAKLLTQNNIPHEHGTIQENKDWNDDYDIKINNTTIDVKTLSNTKYHAMTVLKKKIDNGIKCDKYVSATIIGMTPDGLKVDFNGYINHEQLIKMKTSKQLKKYADWTKEYYVVPFEKLEPIERLIIEVKQ